MLVNLPVFLSLTGVYESSNEMITVLRHGVLFSLLFSFIALTFLVFKTFSLGRKSVYASPQGDWKKGIIYAFGKGMLPWEKESTKKHLPTYLAGFIYHFGIFAALFYTLHLIIPFQISKLLLSLLRVFMASGLLCGSGLLIKRSLLTNMRKISCPDDYVSNILVDLFILTALIETFFPLIRPFFYVECIIMFLYIPMGKIRHCFFFFYSRLLFGYFFGRRGVFPPRHKQLKVRQ